MRGSSAQVLQQVVAGNVGLVTDRGKAGDADIQATDVIEDGQAERTALRRHGDPAGRRIDGRERGVNGKGRIGVQDAHAVRADHTHAGSADLLDELVLQRASPVARFAETGADYNQRADPLAQAVVNDRRDVGRRHDDDGQIDVARNVAHGRVGLQAIDLGRARVHRHEGPGEPGRAQVVQDLGSNPPAPGIGADHGDGTRLEKRPQRGGGRDLRTPAARALGLRRRLEIERDMEHALIEPLRQREPGLQEHVHHRQVVAEDVGVEDADAAIAADFGQPLEHARAKAVSLERIGDGERHFGALRPGRGAIVAGDAAQCVAALGDDQHVCRIWRGDATRLREIDAVRGHETIVKTAFRQPGEQVHDRLGIAVAGSAQADRRTVAQNDIGVEIDTGNGSRHGNRKSTGHARRKRAFFRAFRVAHVDAAGNPAAPGVS